MSSGDEQLLELARRQRRQGQPLHLVVQADRGDGARREVQVLPLPGDQQAQQAEDVPLRVRLARGLLPEPQRGGGVAARREDLAGLLELGRRHDHRAHRAPRLKLGLLDRLEVRRVDHAEDQFAVLLRDREHRRARTDSCLSRASTSRGISTCARLTQPSPSCSPSALSRSSGPTKPSLVSTSPSVPPTSFWNVNACASCSGVIDARAHELLADALLLLRHRVLQGCCSPGDARRLNYATGTDKSQGLSRRDLLESRGMDLLPESLCGALSRNDAARPDRRRHLRRLRGSCRAQTPAGALQPLSRRRAPGALVRPRRLAHGSRRRGVSCPRARGDRGGGAR